MRDADCQRCRLSQTADFVCLLGSGPPQTDVMVIGEAPGRREDEGGKVFVGKTGQTIKGLLEESGINTSKVYFANAVNCRPTDNRTPTKGEIKACSYWLGKQIAKVRPKYVLLLGNTPLVSLTGKAGIKKRRGRPFEQDGILYLPTYHPSYTFHDPKQLPYLEGDVEVFAEIIKNKGIPKEENIDHIIVDSRRKFEEMLADLRGTVSYDCETTGLYPWEEGAKMISLGFGTRDHQWCWPHHHPESSWSEEEIGDMMEEVDEVIGDCYLVAHNAKFDSLWLRVMYGVYWEADFDTMLAHYLLDENTFHGLKYLAKVFCGAPDWEIDKEDKKGAGPLGPHCYYLANDVYYTRRLRFIFGKMLKKDTQVNNVFNKIMMPCSHLFTEAEHHGVYVNTDGMDDVEKLLIKEQKKAFKELSKYKKDINWGSPKQLAELLFEELGLDIVEKTKTGKPSTSESVIKQIDHPLTGALLAWRGATKQLSSFIEGWKPFLDGHRLHPSFKLHGAVTGRLSCEHPNLQQVPRDPKIRSLITAPEGWVLLEADLSQIELRIVAELSGDSEMVYAFMNNIDVHWLTAIREIARGGAEKELVIDTAKVWLNTGKTPSYSEAIDALLKMGPDIAVEINKAWKELRKKAKAINFGFIYGMWWKKFKIYARDNYGVDVTDRQAKESREGFFGLYNGVPGWHKRQKRFARRNGYVRSLSGRKRRLPDAKSDYDSPARGAAERQAVNSPVQSFANELNLMSAIQIRKEFSRNHVRIVGTVHDSILMEVRLDQVERVYTRVLEIMAHPELLDEINIKLKIPITADAGIGPWGNGVTLKKWKQACLKSPSRR